MAAAAKIKGPTKPGFKYRPQFGLIITCESEAEQKRQYQQLRKLGFNPRVVCV
jgi:hypothetical protein